MKIILHIALILTLSGAMSAQMPWSPVHSNKLYTYEKCEPMPNDLGGIDITEWYNLFATDLELCYHNITIVNDTVSNGDSLFSFNKIAKPLASQVWDYYYPTFLNAAMRVTTNGEYYFQGYDTFLLKPQAGLGAFWTYKDTIIATIIDIQPDTLWNVADSIKTILLSNNDTIRLSRNFGIIEFPSDNAYNSNYKLAGVQQGTTTWGFRTPDFWDIYNFEVGDVFMYRRHSINYGVWQFHTYYEKIEITGKTVLPYGYVYTFNKMGNCYLNFLFDYDADTMRFFNIDTLTHSQKPHFHSSYLNYEYTLEADLLSSLGSNIIGWVTFPKPWLWTPTQKSLIWIDYDSNVHYDFATGLGLVHHHLFVFEAEDDVTLIGWVKNGDTTGIVFSDTMNFVSIDKPISTKRTLTEFARLAPNPSYLGQARLLFEEAPKEPVTITVYALTGQLVWQQTSTNIGLTMELKIPLLSAGIYIVHLCSDGREQHLKWVVQ